MTEQPRVTIDAPSEFVILAARHLDAIEGPVQVGSVVDTSTRSAIDRVVAYVTKAHNAPPVASEKDAPRRPEDCPECGAPIHDLNTPKEQPAPDTGHGICTATINDKIKGRIFRCAQKAGHYDEGKMPGSISDPGGWHWSAPADGDDRIRWSDVADGATPHRPEPADATPATADPPPSGPAGASSAECVSAARSTKCACGTSPDPGICPQDCGPGLPTQGHCSCVHEAAATEATEPKCDCTMRSDHTLKCASGLSTGVRRVNRLGELIDGQPAMPILIERAEQAEAERDRYARRADDRADRITRLTADRDGLRTRLAEQEAETMRQHEHAQRAEGEMVAARQDAANAYGQRDRLRNRIIALAERWQLPGHISMPDAAAEIAEALDREKWAPAPDPITRVRALADRWKRNGTRDLARYADIMLAELDDPKPATPADEQYKFATTWSEYNAGRRAALAGQASTNRAAPVEARDPCPHCDQPYPRRLMETHLAVEHPDTQGGDATQSTEPAATRCTATLVEGDATFRCVQDAGHYDESSAPSQAFGGGAVDRGGWHEAECGDGVFQLWADFAEGATSHRAPDAVPSCSPGVPETEPDNHAVAELAQAIRLTREYVGADLLPAVEGWDWYDALRKWAPHELPEPESGSSTSPELGDPGFKETAETLNTGPAVPGAEPDTVTDPAWLCQQYAKAIAADDGHPWDTLPANSQEGYLDNADAVMCVRDRHVDQLRQRLTLAEQVRQDDLAELRRMRFMFEENVRRHNATRDRVDELLAELRALQGVADADSKQLAEVDQRCYRYAATLDRVRSAVHIADAGDATDWQRGYRACADRVVAELDSKQAQAWTPPPGDTREQLPEKILDLIRAHRRGCH